MEHAPSHAEALGRITISKHAITQIVARTASESYGVVGMSARRKVGRLLARDRPRQGITIGGTAHALTIGLYVVVEYGLNLAEVAATIRSRIAYEVERLTGLRVASVEVHIQKLRRSA